MSYFNPLKQLPISNRHNNLANHDQSAGFGDQQINANMQNHTTNDNNNAGMLFIIFILKFADIEELNLSYGLFDPRASDTLDIQDITYYLFALFINNT